MQLERVLAEKRNGRRVEIWFGDEARLGQKNTPANVWAPTGSRPTVPKDLRYANGYIFGAVCPMEKKAAAIVIRRCNTAAMNYHLTEISTQVGPDANAVLILDQAGWHKSKKLMVPDNIVLMYLPPYSPELNPVERIWHFLRSHFLSNRIFADVDAVIAAGVDAWNRFAADANRIASLCHVDWAVLPPSMAQSPNQGLVAH